MIASGVLWCTVDEWDDELSELPVDRRRIRLRRGAYLTVCAGLITLIILTVVFVGNDTKVSFIRSDMVANGPSAAGLYCYGGGATPSNVLIFGARVHGDVYPVANSGCALVVSQALVGKSSDEPVVCAAPPP